MNIYRLLIPFLAIAAAASCSGQIDPDDEKPEGPVTPFTLTVDKTTIESDGKDQAILTIKDAEGIVLTDAEHIRNTSFCINETGEWLSGMVLDRPNVFTSITDGTFTISAMYDGEMCENEVKVTSRNRSVYEKFHKNVAIYRFTATWCGYCPDMTEALSKVGDYTKDHSIVMEMHYNDEFSLEALANYAGDVYKFSGFPYCRYSLDTESGNRTRNDIESFVKEQMVNHPARTGIKASTSVSGNTMKVEAEVSASASGKYDLAMAILKDKCIPSSPEAYEEIYNDVIISISGNYFAMSSDASFSLDADGKKSFTREWTNDILTTDDAKDCRVVLFTLVSDGGKVIIDNAVEMPVGGSVDYRYN